MRIIARSTLRAYWEKHPTAEAPLRAWYHSVVKSQWKNAGELKRQFRTASIIDARRVVFNIAGNHHRLVVDVNYTFGVVHVIWIGTHTAYDRIDVAALTYVKTDKK